MTSLLLICLISSLVASTSFQIYPKLMKTANTKRKHSANHYFMLNNDFSFQLAADLFPAIVAETNTNIISPTGELLIKSSPADDIQNAGIIIAAISYFIYEKRPRGSANAELFEVKKSTIPDANLGLFCKTIIPKETVLGSYPGVLGKVTKALERKSSDKARESAKKYMWLVDDTDTVLDPTNANGALPPNINFFFGLLKADTLMARINEPPVGRDVNVYVRQRGSDLEIIAERDILTGEEIFIDYGYSYDRSSYGADSDGSITTSANDAAKAADLDRRMKAMAKLQKEIDDLTLQPIRDSSLTDDEKSKLSQDTTLTGGFIDKLRKQEVDSKTKKKQNKSGVITPEEGMARFNEIGSGMFSSSDDRDLIDSMLGKKSKKKGGSSRKRNSDDDDEDDDDEDLQESLGSGVSASTGSASKEELDMMDSLFGRKPSSGSIIDIAQTISSDPSTQSEKTSTQASRPTGTTRSIFEQSPSKFKSPEVEAQEVDDEIDNLLKSIKEKNKSKSRNGVSDDGSSSFVDDFAANSYLGALDLLSSEEDEEDDPNDYDYGDDVSVSVSVSKDIFPTSDTTITSKTSLTTSTTPSVTASSQPTQSQSKLQSDSSRNEAIANSGITKSSKMLKAEEELQKQLENMSDDEIKLMFRRIRENIARNNENSGGSQNSVIPVPPPSRGSAARAAAELDLFALNAKKQQQLPSSSSSTAGKGFGTESNANTANSSDTSNNSNVKYPKSQPSDPKVREKYKTELEQFESELENLYRDPLAVWQDMVMNPDILKDLEIPDNDGSGVSGGDDDSE